MTMLYSHHKWSLFLVRQSNGIAPQFQKAPWRHLHTQLQLLHETRSNQDRRRNEHSLLVRVVNARHQNDPSCMVTRIGRNPEKSEMLASAPLSRSIRTRSECPF